MQCERCQTHIAAGEEKELHGRTLCEDCYMDVLSPARACDPWAVHSAKSFEKSGGAVSEVNETQAKILRILKETGGISPGELAEKLQIRLSDLEREFASLRHTEKIRAELRDGKKILLLW